MKEQPMSDEKTMGQVIQIDEARIRDHLGEMVRGTVEETLNAMLDAEADRLCGAARYERSQARQDSTRPVKAALSIIRSCESCDYS
jgi:transposase-like protein